MTLTAAQLAGIIISVLGIAGLAIYSGTKPQTYANVNSAPIIAGIIMGTLVGGSSTVGTAQLAYNYGMSAWWFTLGGGIGCLILALVYIKPMRNSGCMTLVGIISREYGPKAGLAASLLSSAGTFINIISQLISGTAVIAVVAPTLGLVPALIITAAFMTLYVVFGGTQGAGRVGILKLVLLYVSMIGCGIVVLVLTGGISGFKAMTDGIDNAAGVNFYSLFSRGVGKDSGACLSLIFGVLTTQTYAQAVMSGKSDKAARTGALVSAVLIPPIGVGGILVGLYMRANYPGIVAKTALTVFAVEHLPGILCGLVLGTLFIAVVGTGAGLAMGISTIIRRDIIQRFSDKLSTPRMNVVSSRIIIVLVLALGCCLSAGSLGDTILNFAFMSMGLRGAVIFVPMSCAIWLKGRVNKKWAFAGIIAGPAAVLIFGTVLSMPWGMDPLIGGIAASLLCCMAGLAVGTRHENIKVIHHCKTKPEAGHLIIAIDGELHSGSHEIAEALAQEMNIPCYGKEVISEAAKVSHFSEKLMRHYDIHSVFENYDLTIADMNELKYNAPEDLAAAQMAGCWSLASAGPCILLDHFAPVAFKSDTNCVKIFIHGDFENRAEAFAKANNLGPARARHMLHKADGLFGHFYRSYNKGWGRPGEYDITVDSTEDGYETLAHRLIEYLNSEKYLASLKNA